jgi:hypothetical protein
MNPSRLSDRIHWALNIAARATGETTFAYRPSGPLDPMAARNRFLKLPATFSGPNGTFSRPPVYGSPFCEGIFDAAYLRAGDYLKQSEAIWFIAAARRLLPVLCVRTNRLISLARPSAGSTTGANGYGGTTSANLSSLLNRWPASVLLMSREAHPMAQLPADTTSSLWSVLLPVSCDVILQTGDLFSDDLGRNGVVSTTELSDLGWHLAVRQATT